MRKLITYIVLLIGCALYSQPIVVDHRHIKYYDDIPQQYIDSIKKRWLSYAGESHSLGLRVGLAALEDSNSVYQVNVRESGTPETATSNYLRVSRATWGDHDNSTGWIYYYGEEDWWTNSVAVTRTKSSIAYCNDNGYQLDYFAFGWCWDQSGTNDVGGSYDPVYYTRWAGRSVDGPDGNQRWGLDSGDSILTDNRVNMNTYLSVTREYIEYCESNGYPTKVFFTTGPVDNTADPLLGYATGERGYQGYLKWEHIRNYVDTTDFALFDFADILSYNNAGVQNTTTWTDNNGTLQTFPIIAVENRNDLSDYHYSLQGAVKLAKGMWVFLAMMEGWDTTSTESTSDTTKWYMSNTGDNSYSGHHPDSAIRTIAELITRDIEPGDSILFEAGGVWRETLQILWSGTQGNQITFSSYGTGNKPKLLGSNVATDWTAQGTANIWQTATSLSNRSTEYYPGRLWFIENDSVIWGRYRAWGTGDFSNLTQEYDYTVNGTTHYVYAPTDPDTRYDSIEVNQRQRCIAVPDGSSESYLTFDGLEIKFARLAGFDAGYPAYRGATDLCFRNCEIGYIGATPSNFAYGIAAWHSNFLAENNLITDCGRRGISINLYLERVPGSQRNIQNIIVRDNIFKRGYHTTGLDFSNQATGNDTLEHIYFYNNIVDDSEFNSICTNCYSNQVFFQKGDSVSVMNDIYVIGNLFIHASARNILCEGIDTIYISNNTIIGHNPNIAENPYNNVGFNSNQANVYYRNNILYDNLPNNTMQNHGVFIYDAYTGVFEAKDYNLYYSLFPGAASDNRNFSAHRVNSSGGMGYWNTNEWSSYVSTNTAFEQNSPSPINPYFVNYSNHDYHITDSSAADSAGVVLDYIIVTDLFGVVDTINKYDLDGLEISRTYPPIGAYATAGNVDGEEPTVPATTKKVRYGNMYIRYNGKFIVY